MSQDVKVKVGAREVTLAVPASYAQRTEVWLLTTRNVMRANMAALGMCWRGPGRPSTSYQACGFDPAVYGAKVYDELLERGESIREILAAGSVALDLLIGGLVSEAGVKEAEGNSEPEVAA